MDNDAIELILRKAAGTYGVSKDEVIKEAQEALRYAALSGVLGFEKEGIFQHGAQSYGIGSVFMIEVITHLRNCVFFRLQCEDTV